MKPNKKIQTKSLSAYGATALTALFMTACGPSDAPESLIPENVFAQTRFLAERPAKAVSVGEIRSTVVPGREVAIAGLIGGTLEPFVDGFAAFVLADPSIRFCDEIPDEHCATPWDACCEDPDKLRDNRVSVQFVNADNQVLQESLKGVGGLRELSQVIVTGTLSEDSTPENINLLAEKLYLIKE